MKRNLLAILILVLGVAPPPASAQQTAPGVDRLYVLDCGYGTAPNQGRFSRGYNDGKLFSLSDNCYLIHLQQGYLLWGAGIPDKVLHIASGVPSYGGRPNWVVTKGLAKQLEQLDIEPSAIRYIGLANSHIDHIGNLALSCGHDPDSKIRMGVWQNRPSEPEDSRGSSLEGGSAHDEDRGRP